MERKEAIEIIKKNWPDSSFTTLREALETLIPELKESEDERTRERLIHLVNKSHEQGGYALHKDEAEEMIAWLEKQGEQKPTAWNEEDESTINDIICYIRQRLNYESERGKKKIQKCEDWLKSLKDRVQPKQEWSEEDEAKLKSILFHIEDVENKDVIDWLKSLRPQSQWKPSELQIEALESATENCAYSEYQDCLRELIEQLKKLKG